MSSFDQELHRINGKINRWHATEHLIVALALLLAAWGALTALDVWLRPRTYGRLSLSLVLMALAGASLVVLALVLVLCRWLVGSSTGSPPSLHRATR